jgi:hypothetical protein
MSKHDVMLLQIITNAVVIDLACRPTVCDSGRSGSAGK